jgi:predicted acetyltransferase
MTASRLEIARASVEETPVLANLMNHYVYDMAEWFDISSDLDGFYSYDVDGIWTDRFHIYIARLGGIPIGFALIEQIGDLHDLREFFIVRRHRRARFGQDLCKYVWNAHHGEWQVRVFCGNRPAAPFWKRVISGYTNGKYTETELKKDDKPWTYYHFQNDA